MSPVQREAIFQIRISDAERNMLRVLAEEDGLTSSDFVRQFIRREWMRRYGELSVRQKPKQK
jgi:hypothetical protein